MKKYLFILLFVGIIFASSFATIWGFLSPLRNVKCNANLIVDMQNYNSQWMRSIPEMTFEDFKKMELQRMDLENKALRDLKKVMEGLQ